MKKLTLVLSAIAVSASADIVWTPIEIDPNVSFHVQEVPTPNETKARYERMVSRGFRADDPPAGEDGGSSHGGVIEEDDDDYVGGGGSSSGSSVLVFIDKIVNLGLKLWKVVEKNQAQLHIAHSYANALPKGVDGPEDLDDFSAPVYKSYRMHGENTFGMSTYDVTYTLVHRYHGNFKGKGQYLDSVTVLPHKATAIWGYTVDLNVDKVSAVNVGSKDAPIGSVLMELGFRVGTVMKKSEYHGLYDFRGDTKTVSTMDQ